MEECRDLVVPWVTNGRRHGCHQTVRNKQTLALLPIERSRFGIWHKGYLAQFQNKVIGRVDIYVSAIRHL